MQRQVVINNVQNKINISQKTNSEVSIRILNNSVIAQVKSSDSTSDTETGTEEYP